MEKTKTVARPYVWWLGSDQDIINQVRGYQEFQEHQRVLRYVEIPPGFFSVRPRYRLHVEFGGPFHGHYFLVVVDVFSKSVEMLPVAHHLQEQTSRRLGKFSLFKTCRTS